MFSSDKAIEAFSIRSMSAIQEAILNYVHTGARKGHHA